MSNRQNNEVLQKSKANQKALISRLYLENNQYEGNKSRPVRYPVAPPFPNRDDKGATAKRFKLVHDGEDAEGERVGVPGPLQKLVGSSISLSHDGTLSPVRPSNNKMVVSSTSNKQLVPVAPVRRNSARPQEPSSKSSAEYEKYLRSPFSFIDKVIESPYTEEFVYLNFRGPYDMYIVKHASIDPQNYCTMSRAGVTRFFRQETDFTSLDQWEREYFLFTKMMEIPFFHKFRMWKAFYFWKKLIRTSKSNKCRKYLTENLYILNPYLRSSLVELKSLCWQAGKWNLFQYTESKSVTLATFMKQQEEQRELIEKKLEDLNAEVRAIVLRACDVDLREFLINNGFRKSKADLKNSAEKIQEDIYPQKVSHAEKAAIRTKCRNLTKFIRLADYFVIDSLITLCRDRAVDLLAFLNEKTRLQLLKDERDGLEALALANAENGGKEIIPEPVALTGSSLLKKRNEKKHDFSPAFVVDIVCSEQELSFEPQMQTFQKNIESTIFTAVKIAMNVKRLVNHTDFLQFTRANMDEEEGDDYGSVLQDMFVLNDDGFRATVAQIKAAIMSAFRKASAYAESFEPYRVLYVENIHCDIEAYQRAAILVFSNLIQKYEEQFRMFDTMPQQQSVSLLRVDTAVFKHTILPSPKRCRHDIDQLLPRVANERCTELFSELKDANNRISAIPANVEEFVEMTAFLNQVQNKRDELQERFIFIEQLYTLMTEQNIRVPQDDKDMLERLMQIRSAFRTSLSLSADSIDSNTERFSKDLQNEIPKLKENIAKVGTALQNAMVANVDSDMEEVIMFLEDRDQQLSFLEEKAQRFQYYQEVLQVEIVEYGQIRELRNDVDVKIALWSSLKAWSEMTAAWFATKFSVIDVDEIYRHVTIHNKVYSQAKRSLANNAVVPLLRQKISEIQNTLPVVSDLRNKNLLARHWDAINALLNHDIKNDEDFTLGTLIQLNAMQHKGDIATISTQAVQEANLQEQLDKVVQTWADLVLPVTLHKETKDVYILENLEDIIAVLDDSLVNMNTIMGSRFVGPIRDDVNEWNQKLLLLQDTLEEWMNCQRQWIYLENIFSAQDIVRQLPEESKLFNTVDRAWKDLMRRTNDQPNAIRAGTYLGLRDNFQNYNATLDKVQKQLENYLETKRQQFPRFYFLSNDELLEILAQSNSVHAMQPHLRKCFDNIVLVEFEDRDIKAMISTEGERVPMGKNLKARGSVEAWLGALEADMVKTLRRYMKKALLDYNPEQRTQWILNNYGQMVMTVAQMIWCRNGEAAIGGEKPAPAVEKWVKDQVGQLSVLTAMVRGDISSIDRKKLVALITTEVHARDVSERLRDEKVDSMNNFSWLQQLRFYWDTTEDDCIVRQSNAKFDYGYEYMGVCSRLVITPLTDRCWMTITGALHIRFGASPAGPAGTGKTESTKDLAKAMGFLCVVFNCSDQIEYKMMGKLFSGLAQTGAWSCLDEFNRIDIEVLSVIAQQLLQVRQALLAGVSTFIFQGQQIPLKKTFGCMITMNPGYAGRTELPDNLKVLFRPVAMMVPDYALIAEIMLFAEGFDSANVLSKKMVKLYHLSSEQLSQQDHYDFGMRAVKSVLVMAGALKRAEPSLNEETVLIRAMRDSNVPKFVSEDLPLFHAIVQDLFPGVNLPMVNFDTLESAIKSVLLAAGLQIVPAFITKVIQLYDTLNTRFGVMVVGPTGGGKSVCHNILSQALCSLHSTNDAVKFPLVHPHVMNPKCINMGELYGEINPMTQEWTDGLASSIMREVMRDSLPDNHWIVFDGPVDALWIENMNTVLDDNMTLCLVNGERIKLKPEMRILFEVQDLAVASPATVSRCGMVYMTPNDLGYMPYVLSWMVRLPSEMPEELRDFIHALFHDKIEPGLEFLRKECKEHIQTCDINVVTSLCTLFRAIFTVKNGIDFEDSIEDLKLLAELIFCFSYTWSLGGALDGPSADKFSKFMLEIFVNARPSVSFYAVYVDVRSKAWSVWSSTVPEFTFNPALPYSQLLVPTVDSVRCASLLEILIGVEKAVFLAGVTGVGKSTIAHNLFERMKEDGQLVPISMCFSAQTSSQKTQENIELKMIKLRRTQLGAPPGKKNVIFVDDVNMPAVEDYGAQPPIELLRQFCDYKGFYDRKKLFWKKLQDTSLVCAAAPPGGGRSALSPRFVRHFNVMCMPLPSESVMQKIFSSILGGYLSASGFKPVLVMLAEPIVNSTVDLYQAISTALLPTPTKSHYTFNLRDISKVFAGILMAKPLAVPTPDALVRLWIHESARSFCDRLVNQEDIDWFEKKVTSLLHSHFQLSWTKEEVFQQQTIMFGDFFSPGVEKVYTECLDMDKAGALLKDFMEEYNLSASAQMNLVFFTDAIKHAARISRILRQPRGNAMLVGIGGSGKQSLTRLACAMLEYQCLQVEVTRGFGYSDFQEHLKKLIFIAGVEGKHVTFLFNENQIISERFLEDVNSILNSGEVSNLFALDETMEIIEKLTPTIRAMGLSLSRDNVYNMFVQRVRDNLHIVLCMSPVGDAFRTRCRKFPSLINCTTIDWYMEWPEEALYSVARSFLEDLELPSPEMREALVACCVTMRRDVSQVCIDFYESLRRRVYTTPKSYLDMIYLFLSLLEEKRDELDTKRGRLTLGLTKLNETKDVVAELRASLTKMQPVLEEKTRETEALLQQVAIDQAKADKVRDVVQIDKEIVLRQAAEVAEVQADAQTDLDAALPGLRAAIKALDKLEKSEISEIKAMQNPPTGVIMTMEAVCLLLGQTGDWDTAKKVLANVNFLKQIKEFEKDNIDPKQIKKLYKYMAHPNFTPEKMVSTSRPAASLCDWVRSMVTYFKVSKEVEPKKKRVEEMNILLDDANAKLKEKMDQLAVVNAAVAKLKEQSDASLDEKQKLDAKTKQTQARLIRAEKLTTGLASEQVRWALDLKSIAVDLSTVVGNVFVSAACTSYYGAFTGEYRTGLVTKWRSLCEQNAIPISPSWQLRDVLASDVLVRQWTIDGLPNDAVSIDSAVLVKKANRWPLMIDPQGQANQWIKNEHKGKLLILRLDDKHLLSTLEMAVREGLSVLIEDIGETLDASIDPILQKQTFVSGGRTCIHLGDNDVEYDAKFRFYLTTKLANPHYLPEVFIKVTLLNFTVTQSGLEDQLLADVVKKERPDVEQKKNRLVVSMADDRQQLEDIEKRILKMLTESQGNILDDEGLINTLAESKFTSSIILERVKESTETQAVISEVREGYRPAAMRGSILYFVVSSLAAIDPMYQYSLAFFKKLFNNSIDQSKPDNDLEVRLGNFAAYMTQNIFDNVCRGLFESHKLIFSFLMTVQLHRKEISDNEWSLLVREGGGAVARNFPFNSVDFKNELEPHLIDENGWKLLVVISLAVPACEGLWKAMNTSAEWKRWMEAAQPQQQPLPGEWEAKLSPFQKLLVLKACRREKLVFAFRDFVTLKMGKSYSENVNPTLEQVYKDTDSITPVIFVLSMGADPTGLVFRLAKDMGYASRLHVISLGQGQGEHAKKMVDTAKKNGEWVLLQNCHLAKSWMPELANMVEELAVGAEDLRNRADPNFRLWLTSMPCSYFPIPVLQGGIKLTNEPPKGLRANLLRSFNNIIKADEFEQFKSEGNWKNLLFGLCFFHSVVQERKKFGALGWNKVYEFNDSDLTTSILVLRMFLEEQADVPWDALRYVCGQINYGGRVTDDWDRRCLTTILRQYFNPTILSEDFQFCALEQYKNPPLGNMESYKTYIQALPVEDDPQIFGMHDNANISFQRQEGASILETILAIQPREISTTGAKTTDEVVADIASEILENLPKLMDREKAGFTTFALKANGMLDSLGICLLQEMERFNKLLTQIATTLTQLQKTIKGEEVMSQELDMMYTSFLNNQVPGLWEKYAYPSLNPLAAWVKDLHVRMAFMTDWLTNGPPASYWLSGFFFPQGFITGVLQNHARKYLLPIDTLQFRFEVHTQFEPRKAVPKSKDSEEDDIDGVFVYGLFMDGARWSSELGVLCDAQLGELYPPMPLIHFIPCNNHVRNDETTYQCPLYKTAVRAGVLSTTGQSTNFVLMVELPSRKKSDHWIRCGAALLLTPVG